MEQSTFDDLFMQEPSGPMQQGQPEFDKDAWVAKKQEQRETLFAHVEQMADATLSDPAALQRFLQKQGAAVHSYSVTNMLLILKQRPDKSDHVRHEDEWTELGRGIRKGEGRNAILLFRQDHEFAGKDGFMKSGYNVHRYFDISQTYGPAMQKQEQPNIRTLLSALMAKTAVQVTLSESVNKEVGAIYVQQENIIHVAPGMEGGHLFRVVSRELARVEHGGGNSPADTWFASCISNIVGARYGIAPTPIESIPGDIATADPRTKKALLESINQPAQDTIRKMETMLQPYRRAQRESRSGQQQPQQSQPSR
ncbi:hypothetical protein LJC27_05425 [Christensenellaceae bacterium OttesenSCG-928-M15]|nr:hypothetical protein [Christensenellaceae bacterium OttesenSCG-928-M15]